MNNELDQILISPSQPDFEEKMDKLRSEIMRLAMFLPDDNRNKQLRDVIYAVIKFGDDKLTEYTEKFDDVRITSDQFRISKEDLEAAHKQTDKDLLESIRQSIENVRRYQEEIFIGNKNTHPGIKYTPIKRVGICVPGASAPLPSTVIMTAVPAQVAGVEEIVVVSPPRYNGSIHPVILAVCYELGITEVYRIGGAQAVAAMACEKGTIPKVDKIVGPGNKWVQTAKKMVAGDYVGIDSIAGPSEVLIIANEKANPGWVAADMLSQAEHAADSSAIVVTNSEKGAVDILAELKSQIEQLPRAKDAIASLEQFGAIVVVENMDKAIGIANDFASEHLQIQCSKQSREIADKIVNAGAIFIGDYSPVAVGDYWAGPSHTLPTGTRAKFSSALSANDFIKSTSIIEYDEKRLAESAADIIRLAEIEGLDAHARSVRIRQQES